MSEKKQVQCSYCNGAGQCSRTRQVMDMAMSICLGAATGIGMLPTYRTEFYQETCYVCRGKGKKDE